MKIHFQGFTSGELTPLLGQRFGVEKVATGCRLLRNFILDTRGPVFRRPGMEWMGGAASDDAASPSRLVAFNFSTSTSFILELHPGGLRVWSNGVRVPLAAPVPWPYSPAECRELQTAQVNDTMYLAHPSHPPRQLVRYEDNDWRLTECEWVWPALRNANTGSVTLSAAATTGTGVPLTASATLFGAAHVGSIWQIAHRRERASVEIVGEATVRASAVLSLTAQPAAGEQVSGGGVVYRFVTGTAVVAYDVERGADSTEARQNFLAAMNGTGGGPGTAANPLLTASDIGALAGGTFASAVLTITNQPSVGVTVAVGGVPVAAVTGSPGAGQFQIGATKEDTLDNIIAALNPLIVATAACSPRVGNQATCRAATAGTASNSIGVTESSTRLSWSSATLMGGVDASTERIKVTARAYGLAGNGIALAETLAAGSWSAATTSGGVSAAAGKWDGSEERVTDGLRVTGKAAVYTYGSWTATLYLERWNAATAAWDVLRSWTVNKDRNVNETVDVDGDETLRLRVSIGSHQTSTQETRFLLEALDARIYGLVKITSVTSATAATCDVLSTLHSTAATTDWTEGAWSAARGYPRAIALHGGRLWLAGTRAQPQTMWGSVANDYLDWRRSSDDDGSVAFAPASGNGNEIQWMTSQGKTLLIGTAGDEWTLGAAGGIVTPTDYQFERQSAYGSAALPAQLVGEVAVFVQRGGRKLRRIAPRSDSDAWTAADLTVLAEHATGGGIVQTAFSSNPNAILWAVTTEGVLVGMTYEQEQNVFGWHVHETDGLIESVAVIYGAGADEVWLAVRHGATRGIERLSLRAMARDWSEPSRLIYADSARIREYPAPTDTVDGLEHLEGCQVAILADGADAGSATVSGGTVRVSTFARVFVVGLPFTSSLQPMRIDVPMQDGTAQARRWRVARVGVALHSSLGGTVAAGPTMPQERLNMRTAGQAMDAPPPLFTGTLDSAVTSRTDDGLDVIVRQSAPLPLNVAAIIATLDVYGD